MSNNVVTQDILNTLDAANSELYIDNNLVKLNDNFTYYSFLHVEAKAGYKLTDAKMVYTTEGGYDDFGNVIPAGEAKQEFTISQDETKTNQLTAKYDSYIGIEVTSVSYQPQTYTVTQTDLDNFNNLGVVLSAGGVVVGVGDNLGVSELKFEADENHIIDSAIAVYLENGYDDFGNPEVQEIETIFQVSTDAKSATGTLLNKSYERITVLTTETLEPPTDNKDGFNNVYSVTNDDVANVLINSVTIFNGGSEPTRIDGTNYIQTLYVLPFEIDSSLVSGKKNVFLGENDTGVNVDYIDQRNIFVDGGEIVTPAEGNIRDFTNKKIILHLPYFEPLELDAFNVVGETIQIKYKINVYTGDCVVFIINKRTGSEIAQTGGKIGLEIPYKTAFIASESIKYGNDSGVVLNDLKTAFIEVLDSNDNKNIDTIFNTPILDNGDLSEVNGLIVVNDCKLNIKNAGVEELNRIENMLKSGVIIK